jgi:RecA/RadA recombinase
MSPAFKEVTRLAGLPVGAITQVIGKSNSGKSTLAIEAAAHAQKQGILPVFIITENKFSFERAESMGVDFESAIVHSGVKYIEEGCTYVKQILDDTNGYGVDVVLNGILYFLIISLLTDFKSFLLFT